MMIKEMKTSVEGELSSDDAKDIWRPYNNSDHYESVQQKKSDEEGLSTMTYLMDPWDFVSDCANKMLVDKDMDKIDQFKFGEAKQLLLKIMMVFKPLIPEDRQFLEVFHRCKTHYEFLEKLEQESIAEAAKYEKPEENFLKKLKEEQATAVHYGDLHVALEDAWLAGGGVAHSAQVEPSHPPRRRPRASSTAKV